MGNTNTKEEPSLQTVEFLLKNTKFNRDAIKVYTDVVHRKSFQKKNFSFVPIWKEWYNEFIRNCPSGQLTPEMFVNMYKQVFPCGNAQQFRYKN